MYALREHFQLSSGMSLPDNWNGGILCFDLDGDLTRRTNITQGFVAAYGYTIVLEGWMTIAYNGQELTLHKDDLFSYLPGLSVSMIAASDDYRSICLIADQTYTLSLPIVRNITRTAYFSLVEFGTPRFSLKPDDSRHLAELIRIGIGYLNSKQSFHVESLRLLYSLFLSDLAAIEERNVPRHRFSSRIEELFLKFVQLVPHHFIEHRDIGFYADKLCITTTWLSRIVRQVSGHTVSDYINQMLLVEALWLLQTTSFTIAQISDHLHFFDTATFARFFKRMKGMTPKEYRNLMK